MSAQLALDFNRRQAIESGEFGMRRAEWHAQPEFKETAWAAILTLALSGREWCADDVRRLTGPVPEGQSPNLIGALINKAAKQGHVEFVRFTRSAQVQGHGNRLAVWRGAR